MTLQAILLLTRQEELNGPIQLWIQVSIGVLSGDFHNDVGYQSLAMYGVVVGREPTCFRHAKLSTVAQFVHQLD
jgi:hypothetical protein